MPHFSGQGSAGSYAVLAAHILKNRGRLAWMLAQGQSSSATRTPPPTKKGVVFIWIRMDYISLFYVPPEWCKFLAQPPQFVAPFLWSYRPGPANAVITASFHHFYWSTLVSSGRMQGKYGRLMNQSPPNNYRLLSSWQLYLFHKTDIYILKMLLYKTSVLLSIQRIPGPILS